MHLTDEQLNEYLDHETDERLEIDRHLSSCADCAARLQALQVIFDEIESLPDVQVSPEIAVRWVESGSSSSLPRSLTLTMILQAAAAAIAIIAAAPLVMQFLSSYTPSLSIPSLADLVRALQSGWMAWLNSLSSLAVPTIPQIPLLNVSSLFVMLTVIGVFLFWLIGNGLLLRNHVK
jgi:anti-sigma factor RsiW